MKVNLVKGIVGSKLTAFEFILFSFALAVRSGFPIRTRLVGVDTRGYLIIETTALVLTDDRYQ